MPTAGAEVGDEADSLVVLDTRDGSVEPCGSVPFSAVTASSVEVTADVAAVSNSAERVTFD